MSPRSRHGVVGSARRHRHRRGVSYVFVIAAGAMVTTIGLAGVLGARIRYRVADSDQDLAKARIYGASVPQIVLQRLATDPVWRSKYANDAWSTPETMDELEFCYKLVDEKDGDLDNGDDHPVRLYAKAKVGDAVRLYSVLVEPGLEKPVVLAEYTDLNALSQDDVMTDKWWAQYVRPTLPKEAVFWRVTSVELYAKYGNPGTTTDVRLYLAKSDGMPTGTIVEEVAVPDTAFTGNLAWTDISFPLQPKLTPDDALCLALTTTDPGVPMQFGFAGGGVLTTEGGLVKGTPGWSSFEPDKALLYRVHGRYTTSAGGFGALTVVAGTWRREVE